jgi:hypothetical protein
LTKHTHAVINDYNKRTHRHSTATTEFLKIYWG